MEITGPWTRAAAAAGLLKDGVARPTVFAQMSARAAEHGALNLGQGYPDDAPPQAVTEAARGQAACYPEYLAPSRQIRAPLSEAELQVLRLLCADRTNAEIGQLLDIKLSTVKTHVSHILDKLQVTRRSQIKAAAARLHLIDT